MFGLALLWVVFAVMFSVVGIFHVRQSWERVGRVSEVDRWWTIYDDRARELVRITDEPFKKLVGELNRFVSGLNQSNRRVNLVESLGYLAAALTALVSELVELKMFGG